MENERACPEQESLLRFFEENGFDGDNPVIIIFTDTPALVIDGWPHTAHEAYARNGRIHVRTIRENDGEDEGLALDDFVLDVRQDSDPVSMMETEDNLRILNRAFCLQQ